MKKRIASLVACLLSVLLASALIFIPASALAFASVTIKTYKIQDGSFVNTNSFKQGEKIYLPISFTGVQATPVKGFSCEVRYDSEKLDFEENAFDSTADKNSVLYANADAGVVYVLWDTTSDDTIFNNDTVFLSFNVKENANAESVGFGMTVKELYSTGNQDIGLNNASSSVSAEIASQSIPQETLDAIRKLENITVNSLDDITNAETAWNSLDKNQKTFFKSNYAKEYNWLETAKSRYNKALNSAQISEIENILNKYKSDYSDVFSMTEETVKLIDKDLINAAKTAYSALPSTVTTRLDKDLSNHFERLLEAIDAIEEANKAAEDYKNSYGYLKNVTKSQIEELPELYGGYVDEAIMVYDLLPERAKDMVKELYNEILKKQKIYDDIIAGNKEKEAIRAEINDFQQKWLKVFILNAGNVTVHDKTAIEMAIADFKKLSKGAQESFGSRITSLSGLLDVISELEEQSPDSDGTDDSDNIANSDSDSDSEPEVKETIIEKLVKTVSLKYLNKDISKTIKILFALLGISVLSLLFPLIMTLKYKKSFPNGKILSKEGNES